MSEDYDHPSEVWLIVPKVSVVEAALLTIGIEPQGVSEHIEAWSDKDKPKGYLAARQAIVSAIRTGLISGEINNLVFESPQGGYDTDHLQYDFNSSPVDLYELQRWLKQRGYRQGFLFIPDEEKAGFRDPAHPRYSAKLAAAVEAWESYDVASSEPGRVKQRLAKWLRMNASKFGLTNDDGNPSETVVDDLAKVANWDTMGGAPKHNDGESAPDK